MDLVLQGLVSGLLTGGIYAIVAMGLAVQFSVMGVINFAQGVFLMLGAYIALYLNINAGLDPYLGSIVAFGALFVVGWLVMGGLLERLLGGELALPLLATFGIAVAVQSLMTATVGATPRTVASTWASGVLRFGEVVVPLSRLVAFGLAAASVVLLVVLVRSTKLGRFMRAASAEPTAAALTGIDVDAVNRFAFALGSGLAGFAGAVILPIFRASPFLGDHFMLNAFLIILIGGLGSIAGAGLVGLLVGVLEGVGTLTLPGSMSAALLFLLLVVVMLFRPYGLFGGRRQELIYRPSGH
jgi:branched-chain amino acid transport system permease protein